MMSVSRIPKEQVKHLRSQGWTYAQIGGEFGVSRQRVWALANDYDRKHYKSPRYKMYKRHAAGHTRPYKPCDFCQEDRQN